MTTRPSTPPPASDREALSALFDGELVGDAARFALKRLDHDHDWRATCERWQSVGDVLRSRNAPLPATFPYRVRAAVHAHAREAGDRLDVPGRASAHRLRNGGFRWGSVALAASAALVAFFLARVPYGSSDAPPASAQVATAQAPGIPQAPPATQAPDTPGADLESATAAVAVAAIARPARNRNLQRDRAATDRMVSSVVAAHAAVTGEAGPPPVALTVSDEIALNDREADPSTVEIARTSPFSSEPATEMRPWPRAVLPQYGGGALSADYATRPSFYPFVPAASARQQETQPGDARSAPAGVTTNPQSPPPPSP